MTKILAQLDAPAKINLTLEIIHRRTDGYHELNTIFHRVAEPHDRLTAYAANEFSLSSDDPTLDVGESNLITKAYRAFSAAVTESAPVIRIELEKKIPMGAGLGGGSSDAASTLLLCNRLSKNPLSKDRLMEVGLKLGADVPFFVSEMEIAIARGIGELLSPIDLNIEGTLVVVKDPTISIGTKEAYGSLKLNLPQTATNFDSLTAQATLVGSFQDLFRNDFEQGLFALNPDLAQLKAKLITLGASFAQMTGSGSAFYAIFSNEKEALAGAQELMEIGLSVWVNPEPQRT